MEGIFRFAAVVDDRRDEKLREDEMAVGGPAERVDQVAEGLCAARVFLAFEEAAALAIGLPLAFFKPSTFLRIRPQNDTQRM